MRFSTFIGCLKRVAARGRWPVWIAGGLLAAAMVAGCTQKTPEERLARARALHAKGDVTAAIIDLKDALSARPDFAQARFELGAMHNENLDGSYAEAELRRAGDLGLVAGGRVTAELGRALLLQSQYKKVLDEIKIAPAFEDKVKASVVALRGHAQLSLGQVAEARASLAEAAALQSDDIDVLALTARIKTFEKEPDAALALLDRILERNPKHLETLLFKADLLRYQGKQAETLQVYENILKSAPKFLRVRFARASLYLTLGNTAAAQKDVDAMRGFARNHALTTYMQALVHYTNGKYREAQGSIQDSLKANAEYLPARLLAAAIHHALGSYTQAERALRPIVAEFPNFQYARMLLAATQLGMNQSQQALHTIEPMLAKDLKNGALDALAGNAYMQLADYGKATEFLQRAVAAAPKDSDLRTRLGLSRLGAGQPDQAIADLAAATDLAPADRRGDYLVISVHMRRREFDKAVEAINKLQAKEPKSPVPHHLMGMALLGKNDAAEARRKFERALEIAPTYLPAAQQLAQLDLREKKTDAARKRYESILAKDPNNSLAMTAIAGLSMGLGKVADATLWMEKAAKANPANGELQLLLAGHYLTAGDVKKALAAAQAARVIRPNDPSVLDTLGLAQLRNGEINAALATLNDAVGLAQQSAHARYRLASAKALANDHKGAEAALLKALELQPDHADALNALAMTHLEAGRGDQALQVVRQIQKFYPKAARGYELEGEVQMIQKKYPQALKSFETALELGNSGVIAVKIYKAQARSGNIAGAMDRLDKWISQNADDLDARMYLADGMLQNARWKEAALHLEFLRQKRPKDWLVQNNLAAAYQQLKDPRALPLSEQLYKAHPDNPFAADTLGWLLFEQGDLRRSLELLEKASAKAPKSPTIRYHFARALMQSGDRVRAKKELQQAIAAGKFPELEAANALLKEL